jgi:hypothetical protein
VQQQSPGVTHIRDRLLAGGFAANPFSVGCVRFSTSSKNAHTPPGEVLRGCYPAISPYALRGFFAHRRIHATMQKIPFGIRMPNKPFCPFAQMDKVQMEYCQEILLSMFIDKGYHKPIEMSTNHQ